MFDLFNSDTLDRIIQAARENGDRCILSAINNGKCTETYVDDRGNILLEYIYTWDRARRILTISQNGSSGKISQYYISEDAEQKARELYYGD